MTSPFLILDCNFLVHRGFHSMHGLKEADVHTAVPLAFLREVVSLQDHFQTKQMAFAFDYGPFKRRQIFSDYKANRTAKTAEEASVSQLIGKQAIILENALCCMGFNNVFSHQGYEADDIIASLTQQSLPLGSGAIIVASDKDLYQLLENNRVEMWDPRKKELFTAAMLEEKYGVPPRYWYKVKALAGCPGDGVIGIKGVGEKTAAQYIMGMIPEGKKKYHTIRSNIEVAKRNTPLVKLPYEGCPIYKLAEDNVTETKWREACEQLGLSLLLDKPPACARKG